MTDFFYLLVGLVWDNLITGSPSFIVLAVVFLTGAILLRVKQGKRPSIYAIIPLAGFFVLFCLNQMWNVVEIPPPVGYWQGNDFVPFDETKDADLMMALEAAREALIIAAQRQGSEHAHQLTVAVTEPARVNANLDAHKLYLMGIFLSAVAYAVYAAWQNFRADRRTGDILAILMMGGLAWAEVWTAFLNYGLCNFIEDTTATEQHRSWGATVATAVCDREVFPVYEFIPIIAILGLMFWACWRYVQAAEQTD